VTARSTEIADGTIRLDRGWGAARTGSPLSASPVSSSGAVDLGAAAGTALERYAAGLASEPETLDAIGRIARAARFAGVGPDRVVAAVKAGWYALPAVLDGRVSLAESRTRLARVVSACIDAYFDY
jgi:hypothetical protein